MEALENKIAELENMIEQYEIEIDCLEERLEHEKWAYQDRMDELEDLERLQDEINEQIDDRLVTMEHCKTEALDLVDEFKYIPLESVRNRKTLVADIKYMSNSYKEEKREIEKLLDEIDKIRERVTEIEETGDLEIVKIEEEIILREEKIKEYIETIAELEKMLHEMVLKIIEEVVAELKKRSAGNGCLSIEELMAINPDLSEKMAQIMVRAEIVLGTTFEDYLLLEGILK